MRARGADRDARGCARGSRPSRARGERSRPRWPARRGASSRARASTRRRRRRTAATSSSRVSVDSAEQRRVAGEHALLELRHRDASRPRSARRGTRRQARRLHHLDVVASRCSPWLAGKLPPAERHAEARQHERADERAHRGAVCRRRARAGRRAAPPRRRRAARTAPRDTADRGAGARAASRPARSAAHDAVAEPRADQPRRRGGEHVEIEERRDRRARADRSLEAVLV